MFSPFHTPIFNLYFSDASIIVSAEIREMELAEQQQRERLKPVVGGGGRPPYKNRSGLPNNPPADRPKVRAVDPTEGQIGRDQIR
jgi:hypothetical protein